MKGLNMARIVVPIIRNSENWLILFLGALSTYFFAQTFHYRSGAALFPRIVSTVVAILCFYHLTENIWKSLKNPPGGKGTGPEPSLGLAWYGSLTLLLLYLLLIYVLGFILATGLFMVTFPAIAGYRRWRVILPTALVTTLLIDVSFNRFLQIQLHEGVLFNLFP